MKSETLIYGLAKGNTESWQEDLLYAGGQCLTEAQIERVKTAASANGFHSFRVAAFDGSAPEFKSAALNKVIATCSRVALARRTAQLTR